MDKIRFGVIGTNFVSDWMLDGAVRDPRFELVAVCSRRIDTAQSFAARHCAKLCFTSVDELVACPEVDAVYVASPNACHAEQTIALVRAGKHVLCEKPLASNAAEVSAMTAEAQRAGVVLMEAMRSTLTPNFSVIRENIHRVGTVRRVVASYCQYSSRYDALKEGRVANAFRPELSNGAVMDIGVYCIYPIIALFGLPDNVISSALMLPTGADGQGSAILHYDGFDAVVLYSKIADSHLPSEIQGEDGTITIDRIESPRKIIFIPRDKALAPIDLSVDVAESDYYYEMREFLNLICEDRRESAVNSHANSLRTIRVIDEIRRQCGVHFPADRG